MRTGISTCPRTGDNCNFIRCMLRIIYIPNTAEYMQFTGVRNSLADADYKSAM